MMSLAVCMVLVLGQGGGEQQWVVACSSLLVGNPVGNLVGNPVGNLVGNPVGNSVSCGKMRFRMRVSIVKKEQSSIE